MGSIATEVNNADCVEAEGVDIADVYRSLLYCQTTFYQPARKCLRESGQTHRGTKLGRTPKKRLQPISISGTGETPPGWRCVAKRSLFKAAYITPLLKKSGLDPADVKSYRPISN